MVSMSNATTEESHYLRRWHRRTIARFAEAVIPVDEPEVDPAEVARTLDCYLSLYESRRKWRIKYVILGLELAPLMAGRPPLSWMSLERRRRFVTDRLRTCHGIWGKVSMGKQLVLLAYYGRRASDARMGFTPFEQRERSRRLLALAPEPGVRAR